MTRIFLRSLNRLLAMFLVLVLVATACGGGSDDPGDDGPASPPAPAPADPPPAPADPPPAPADPPPAPSDPPPAPADPPPAPADPPPPPPAAELTASWRGVTADTITVGISMLDFGFLVDNGFSTEGWGDQELVWQTYIDDLNARGGINGRAIEPIYKFYSPVGTTEAEAVCLELTADVETFAVIGGFLGPAETVNTCITDTQETILLGGRVTDERLAQSKAPWILLPERRERRIDAMLGLLEQQGMLEGRKIAVVGSVELSDIFEGAGEQLAARGVEPVVMIPSDVPQGEIQAENDAWQIYAERIRAEGADTLLVIGAGQSAIRGVATNGLDVEIWMLDSDSLTSLGAATTPDMADGAITLTALTQQEEWESEGVQTQCVDVFTAANPDVVITDPDDTGEGDEQWYNPIVNYCVWLQMFEKVATAAGPELTHESFQAGINSLTEFSLPNAPFASFGPDKPDANDSFRLATFDASVGADGGLVAITDILDGTP